MAWTTPRTWSTSELVTAALLNTHVRDNQNYLKTAVAAQIMLFCGGGWSSTTNGCGGATQLEQTTNDVDILARPFDGTSAEYWQVNHPLPADYGGGTVTAKFYWTSSATDTDGVTWGLQGTAFADSDALDASWGTAQEVTDNAQSTAYDLYVSSATSAITVAGTPAAGEMIQWRVYRDPDDAGDTMSEDALLLWVAITYTRT